VKYFIRDIPPNIYEETSTRNTKKAKENKKRRHILKREGNKN